jgi:hypothetical protein
MIYFILEELNICLFNSCISKAAVTTKKRFKKREQNSNK